jgi:hypothetical protein
MTLAINNWQMYFIKRYNTINRVGAGLVPALAALNRLE